MCGDLVGNNDHVDENLHKEMTNMFQENGR